MPRRKDPRIPDTVLDQLLAGADPKTVFDPNGLLDDLKKALAERVLNAEMDGGMLLWIDLSQPPALIHRSMPVCKKNTPRFRGIDTENLDDVAGLVSACAPTGRAFIKRMCEKNNSTCRVSAGLLMFFLARDAVLKRRAA